MIIYHCYLCNDTVLEEKPLIYPPICSKCEKAGETSDTLHPDVDLYWEANRDR